MWNMSRSNLRELEAQGGWRKEVVRMLCYASILSIPFGTRKLLFHFTPGIDEYEAVWLYASDIALLLFWGVAWKELWSMPAEKVPRPPWIAFTLFLLAALCSVFAAPLKLFALLQFVRLFLTMLFGLAVAKLVASRGISRKTVYVLLGALAAGESLCALLQFIFQRSIGLALLGESVLGQQTAGTAKIVIEGVKFIRGYGTFPHPNVLGAFLGMGLIALSYLFLLNMSRPKEKLFGWFLKLPRMNTSTVAILLGLDLTLFGLVLTFSRAAWAVAGIAMLLFFICMWLKRKEYGISLSSLCALVLVFVVLSGIIVYKMSWAIFPRAAVNLGEPAVSYRLAYTELGITLSKAHPLGVGIGNSVFYAVKSELYQKMGMREVWAWQPVHNLYLLISSEVGIAGLVLFLAAIFLLFAQAWEKTRSHDPEFAIAGIMLFALLLFGLTDHFLWTLESGRLMLWLTIGLMVRLNKAGRASFTR